MVAAGRVHGARVGVWHEPLHARPSKVHAAQEAAGHSLAVDRAGALWTWDRIDSAGGGR